MRRLFFHVTLIGALSAAAIAICACSAQITESQAPNIPDNSLVVATPTSTPANFADEYFAKAWKEKFEESLSEIEVNRSLWKASGIGDYRFAVSKSAGGNTNTWNRLPVVITVSAGQRTSIEKKSKDEDYVIYSRTDGFDDFDTFDKLFDYLRRELESGRIVSAKYDRRLGYPKHVQIEFAYHNHGSRFIQISALERIK